MKVSKSPKTNLKNSTNLSNEYVDANLTDHIQYKVVLKDLSEQNQDISERFLTKQRVVKEKTLLVDFRIPKEI